MGRGSENLSPGKEKCYLFYVLYLCHICIYSLKVYINVLIVSSQNEVKQLTAQNEELKSTMEVEKEKLHALEAAMEELHRRGRFNCS